jgi:hypothetical protein
MCAGLLHSAPNVHRSGPWICYPHSRLPKLQQVLPALLVGDRAVSLLPTVTVVAGIHVLNVLNGLRLRLCLPFLRGHAAA